MEKDNALKKLPHGFKAPNGDYFKTLENNILDKMAISHIETSGFKAPKNYFNTLENKVLNHPDIKQKPVKVLPILTKKHVIYISGIAATLALLFSLTYSKSNTSFDALETQTVENYILNENIDSYDIAQLLNDSDLNEESFIEHDLSNNNIESYLINQLDIENIILE